MIVKAALGSGGGGHALLVHGGAGDSSGTTLDGQIEACRRAVEAAKALLEAGASALDVVQRAVEVLEDDARLNSATGGALTSAGTLELDASIMRGSDLAAGAVCSLPPFSHPVAIARAVLEDGKHVLYSAEGAVTFARAHGFNPANPTDMITAEARVALASVLANRVDTSPKGTVGAVAIDRHGHVAAATSTGGITGKQPGRVGDSAIVGAGTYADDALGAASATGQGEGILRVALCHRTLVSLATAGTPAQAAFEGLGYMKERTGAVGGLIVIGRDGQIGWARSTPSMPYAATWAQHGIMAGG